MSKLIEDRKVNRNVKKLNRQLRKDVFGDRFYARQVRKSRADGVMFYQYELIDNECPERNTLVDGWLSAYEIYMFNHIWIAMNDFIVSSDFWEKYRQHQK